MTTADLQRLETAIGRPLSRPVRQFFLDFPRSLRRHEEERDPDTDGFELTDRVADLIGMNTPGGIMIPSSSGRVSPYPGSHIFALGSGACGETWWVDLDDQHGEVYFCDAGTYAEDSDRVADSIGEFASRFPSAEE